MGRVPGFEKDLALLYEQADRAPAGSEERQRLLHEAGQLSGARRRAAKAVLAASQKRGKKGQRHA